MYTPANGFREATVNIQGRTFSLRAPIIRFQYCALTCLYESACVLLSLFYNPAGSVSQSGSYSAPDEEEGKLDDRLRHNQIHYSSAVSQRITIQTHEDLYLASIVLEYKYIQTVTDLSV